MLLLIQQCEFVPELITRLPMRCSSSNDYPVFKVVLIGDSGVGKTCLQSRLCEKGFPSNTFTTVGVEFGSRYIFLNGRKILLQLWDTAGMERYRKTMPQLYYRNANAILFVYDMTDLKTFNNIGHWIRECQLHQENSQAMWLLIGNKCDCVNNITVSMTMAEQFAKQHNMRLYQTSAKDNVECRNIEIMLLELTRDLDSQNEFVEENSKICFVPGYREPVIIKRQTQTLHSLQESGIISESGPFCRCL